MHFNGKTMSAHYAGFSVPPVAVVVTENEDGTFAADHTLSEILTAHDSGNIVYCIYKNMVLSLVVASKAFCAFSDTYSGKVHTVTVGYNSITVTVDPSADAIEFPETAAVGQTIAVQEVDDNGKPVKWQAVDFPAGGGDEWEELMNITTEEEVTKVIATLSNPGRFKMMSLYWDLRKSDTNTTSLMVAFDVNNPDKWTPNNNYTIISILNQGTTDTTHCCYVHFQPTHTMTNACNLLQGGCQWGATKFITADTVVSSVSVATHNNANVFGVGSIIKVYGVRA